MQHVWVSRPDLAGTQFYLSSCSFALSSSTPTLSVGEPGDYDWLLVDYADRLYDWATYCGIPGGIPNRTTVYAYLTLANTVAEIVAAIAACPSGQVVYLAAGTYNLGNIVWPAGSGKTLRGAGAGQTILRPTSTGNLIRFAETTPIEANGRDVASGYEKGSTAIVLATAPGALFTAGNLVYINEENSHDKWATNIGVYLRDNGTYAPRMYDTTAGTGAGRNFTYTSRITAVNGNTISLATPIPLSFTTSGIRAYPINVTGAGVSMCGIENLTIDGNNNADLSHAITGYDLDRVWVKDVEIKNYSGGDTGHIGFVNGFQCEVRRCYIHDCVGFPDQADGQGICFDFFSCNNLLVDTIAYRVASLTQSNACSANAIIYNCAVDMGRMVGGTGQTPAILHHGGHGGMNLIEGNICNQLQQDGYHGSMSHETIFRNNFHGLSPGLPTYTWLRQMVQLCRWSYYFSCVGNVLGDSSWEPVAYQVLSRASWDDNGEIYGLGYVYPTITCSYYDAGDPDPNVEATLFRHGNYDYYNDAAVWDGGIASHSIPGSLIYASKPAFFGSLDWPPIGPDVTGLVKTIPAKHRWDNFVVSADLDDLFADES